MPRSIAEVNTQRRDMDLLVRLFSHSSLMPHEPAIRVSFPRQGTFHTVTYEELAERITAVGAWVDRNTLQSGVVAIACPSGIAYVVAYLAILAANRIVHPIPQNSSPAELVRFLTTTNASALIGDAAAIATAQDLPVATLDASASPPPSSKPWLRKTAAPGTAAGLLLPSSGTTGLPKIAVRSRDSLDAVARNVALAAGLTARDRVLATVPMSHSYGMENGLLGPIWAGSCIHIIDRGAADGGFDVGELFSELIQGRATVFPAVPFMLDVLAKLSPETGTHNALRMVYTAGSPLPDHVAAAFEQRFGRKAGQLYGATELGSVTFALPDANKGGQNVGHPLPDVSIRILDADNRSLEPGNEGQVAVRAASMLSSYLGGDRSAILDGHFLTGDLGKLEPDGSLSITGRLKLLIDIGGFKVNPMEVEQVLCRHPSVGEAVVIPITVTDTVRRLKAIVTPARPGSDVPVEEVRSLVRATLAAHKVPRIVEVVDRLPKSPTGKILRRQLESGT